MCTAVNRDRAALHPPGIAGDPGHASVRRHRFQSVDAWVVTVRGEEEDWAILWRPHETEPDVMLVAYVGPASFL